MENTPFVSVVIPTYNRKEMLKKCLDSLFNQTYPRDKYEIIVVNDGSTDGTEEVLKYYADNAQKVLKWFSQENKGVSAATNLGIQNSKGEIICFTGDDCIAERDWIKNLVGSFSDSRISSIGGEVKAHGPDNIIEKYSEKKGILNQKKFRNSIITGSAAYRKDVLDEIGGFDTDLRNCVDIDISMQVRLSGYELGYNPKAIVYHHHISTLKGLIKQQFYYGKGNARLNKKYTEDFKPSYNMILIPLKIIHRVITYPIRILRAPFIKDKKYYLAEPVLDISVFASHFLGILNETLLGKPYVGDKYNKKLEFIEEQSITRILQMTWSKIRVFNDDPTGYPTKIPTVSASKMDVQPFVSIVIPTYNRKEMLKECIDSLIMQSYPTCEIIIIDDGSTDGTKGLLEGYSKNDLGVNYFHQENKGPGAARNLGIKYSKGEIICFTDDDCIADKDWTKNLVETYTDKNVGGIGGKIVDYKIETIIERYIRNRKLLNQEKFFSPVVGVNVSYRKRLIEKIGFFDESFRLPNCEDVDLGIRVKLKGFEIKYAPEAIIYHKHRATLKGLIKQQYNYGKGNARLHKKYTKDFYPSYNMILISLKILHRIITYPVRILRAPSIKDTEYYLAEPVLDMLVFASHFFGIVNETIFGKPYVGDKYNKKLEFIGEQSISKLLGMIWSKIRVFNDDSTGSDKNSNG